MVYNWSLRFSCCILTFNHATFPVVEICDLVNVRTCILIFFVLDFIITIIAFQWRALTNSHGRLPKNLVQMDFFILFLLFVVDVNSDICFLFLFHASVTS